MEHTHGHNVHLFLELINALDPWSWAGVLAIMSFSFIASLHCGVMCGPLVCGALGSKAHPLSSGIWLYNAGRLFSYALGGLILGGFGATVGSWFELPGQILAGFLGLLLLVHGLRLFVGWPRATRLSLQSMNASDFFRPFIETALKFPPGVRSFALGFLTLFLPCMTLSPALLAAAATGSAASGFATMVGFFIGTLPIMTIFPAVAGVITKSSAARSLARLGGAFLILAALITFARVLHH